MKPRAWSGPRLWGPIGRFPAGRYKTNADVTLPLSQAARGVLAAIPRFQNCPYVFTNDGRSPISGFSRSKKAFDQVCGVKGWTLHDLRRTARSLMCGRVSIPTMPSGALATRSKASVEPMTGTPIRPKCCGHSRRWRSRSTGL